MGHVLRYGAQYLGDRPRLNTPKKQLFEGKPGGGWRSREFAEFGMTKGVKYCPF
jgi:hypothetical protein